MNHYKCVVKLYWIDKRSWTIAWIHDICSHLRDMLLRSQCMWRNCNIGTWSYAFLPDSFLNFRCKWSEWKYYYNLWINYNKWAVIFMRLRWLDLRMWWFGLTVTIIISSKYEIKLYIFTLIVQTSWPRCLFCIVNTVKKTNHFVTVGRSGIGFVIAMESEAFDCLDAHLWGLTNALLRSSNWRYCCGG